MGNTFLIEEREESLLTFIKCILYFVIQFKKEEWLKTIDLESHRLTI
jgi:hypothetical protein